MNYNKRKITNFILNEPILINHHVNPDGDTIGSMFALYYFVKQFNDDVKLGITKDVIKEWPEFLQNLYAEEINNLPSSAFLKTLQPTNDLKKYVSVSVDFRPLNRAAFPQLIEACKKQIIFDHHDYTPEELKQNVNRELELVSSAASTTQLLSDYFQSEFSNDIPPLSKSALLKGLLTDTGLFKFDNTQKYNALSTANQLIQNNDVNYTDIINSITRTTFEKDKQNSLIKKYVLDNTELMNVENKKIAYFVSDNNEYSNGNYNIKYKAVDFMNNWNDVDVVITAQLQPNQNNELEWKFSIRSLKEDIRSICRQYNGNGHALAGGFTLPTKQYKNITEIKNFIKDDIKKELKNLFHNSPKNNKTFNF